MQISKAQLGPTLILRILVTLDSCVCTFEQLIRLNIWIKGILYQVRYMYRELT